MKDEPVMSILSGIVMAAEAVVGSQSRFYDDVQPDHHKTPVFAMLDRSRTEMVVDERYFPGPGLPSLVSAGQFLVCLVCLSHCVPPGEYYCWSSVVSGV